MVAYQGAAERPYAKEFEYGQGYDIRITIAAEDRKLLADLADIQNQSTVVGLASVERGMASQFNYGQGGVDVFTPFRREQLAAQSQTMRLQMQGLRVLGTMPGATSDQRDLLTLQEQELRSQELGLQRGRLDPNDVLGQQVADASQRNLQLERQVLFARAQARNDPAAGFQVGLSTAADEFAQAGTRMETIAKDLATNMSKSLSDGFFDVITGNFKDLPNVGLKFAQDMLRNITGELAKFITGGILQQFRQALFGTSGSSPGFNLASVALGGGGGGADSSVIAALVRGGYSLVQGPDGQTYAVPTGGTGSGGGLGLTNLPVGSIAQYLLPDSVKGVLMQPLGSFFTG